MYGAQQSFVPNYNYNYNFRPAKKGHSIVFKVAIGLFVAFVAFILLCVGVYYIGSRTKEYDFGKFTITLPTGMEKQPNSGFGKAYGNLGATEAKIYENSRVRFAYLYFSKDDKSIFASLGPELIVNSLSEGLKDDRGYLELDKGEDYIKYNAKNNDDEMTYCHVKVKDEKNGVYVLFLICNEENQSNYEKKFNSWFDSFKVK